MREILFRAKHIHTLPGNRHLNGEWVEGCLSDKNYINSPNFVGEILVDESTVCQYTGLTDKNGRKIFEGDIIKHFNNPQIPSNFDEGIISWCEKYCKFHRSSLEDQGFYLINSECQYEVIGNIFDNPELLNQVGNREVK